MPTIATITLSSSKHEGGAGVDDDDEDENNCRFRCQRGPRPGHSLELLWALGTQGQRAQVTTPAAANMRQMTFSSLSLPLSLCGISHATHTL